MQQAIQPNSRQMAQATLALIQGVTIRGADADAYIAVRGWLGAIAQGALDVVAIVPEKPNDGAAKATETAAPAKPAKGAKPAKSAAIGAPAPDPKVAATAG